MIEEKKRSVSEREAWQECVRTWVADEQKECNDEKVEMSPILPPAFTTFHDEIVSTPEFIREGAYSHEPDGDEFEADITRYIARLHTAALSEIYKVPPVTPTRRASSAPPCPGAPTKRKRIEYETECNCGLSSPSPVKKQRARVVQLSRAAKKLVARKNPHRRARKLF